MKKKRMMAPRKTLSEYATKNNGRRGQHGPVTQWLE